MWLMRFGCLSVAIAAAFGPTLNGELVEPPPCGAVITETTVNLATSDRAHNAGERVPLNGPEGNATDASSCRGVQRDLETAQTLINNMTAQLQGFNHLRRSGGSVPVAPWAVPQSRAATAVQESQNKVLTATDLVNCVLKANGDPACWGDTGYNWSPFSLTSGWWEQYPSPAPEGGYVAISASKKHICAIVQSTRQISCWGSDDQGESTPPVVPGGFLTVEVGWEMSCGIATATEKPHCWGRETQSIGTTECPSGNAIWPTGTTEEACGSCAYGGDLTAPNVALQGITVGKRQTWGSFAGGDCPWACGVKKTDETVVCWGCNAYGQADPIPGLPTGQFTVMATGERHTCAVRKSDKQACCWGGYGTDLFSGGGLAEVCCGSESPSSLCANSGGSHRRRAAGVQEVPYVAGGFKDLTASKWFTCGIEEVAETVNCWGGGNPWAYSYSDLSYGVYYGPTFDPTGNGKFVTIAAMGSSTYAMCGVLKATMSPVCWGKDEYMGSGTAYWWAGSVGSDLATQQTSNLAYTSFPDNMTLTNTSCNTTWIELTYPSGMQFVLSEPVTGATSFEVERSLPNGTWTNALTLQYPAVGRANITVEPNTATQVRMRGCNTTSCTSYTTPSPVAYSLPVLASITLLPSSYTIAVTGVPLTNSGTAAVSTFRCALSHDMANAVESSSLQVSIGSLSSLTTYTIWCKVENTAGWSGLISSTIQTLPETPVLAEESARVVVSATSVTASGGIAVGSEDITIDEYRCATSADMSGAVSSGSSTLHVVVPNLDPNTEYVIFCQAGNSQGWSGSTNRTVTTLPDFTQPLHPVSATLNFSIVGQLVAGAGSASIPNFRCSTSADMANSVIASGDATLVINYTSINYTSLISSTNYPIWCQVRNGTNGTDWGAPAALVGTTLPVVSSQSVLHDSQQGMVVSATLSTGSGAATITDFRCALSSDMAQSISSGSSSLSVAMQSLEPNTHITVWCQAQNSGGWSPAIVAQTTTVPAVTNPVVAVLHKHIFVTSSLQQPCGNVPIINYRCRISSGGNATVFSGNGTLAVVIDNVAPNTDIEVECAAENSMGWGPANASAATTTPTLAEPLVLSVSQEAIAVSASLSPGSGNVTITSFRCALSADMAQSVNTTEVSSLAVTIQGLVPNTDFTVYCQVQNQAGWAPSVTAYTSTLPILASPLELLSVKQRSIIVEGSHGQGGAAALQTFRCSTSEDMSLHMAQSAALAVTVSGLTRATHYTIYCQARNRGGWSPILAVSTTTLPDAPGKSVIKGVDEVKDKSVLLFWDPPATTTNHGGGLQADLKYELIVKDFSTGVQVNTFTVLAATAGPYYYTFENVTTTYTSYRIKGLAHSTAYSISLSTTNVAGTGETSDPLKVTTISEDQVARETVAFGTTLALDFSEWSRNTTLQTEVKRDVAVNLQVAPSQVQVVGARAGSTVLDFEIVVEDDGAKNSLLANLDVLQNATAEGNLTLGGSPAVAVSTPTTIVSNGPYISSLKPTIAAASAPITVELTSSGEFTQQTQCLVDGKATETAYADATLVRCHIPSVSRVVTSYISVVGSQNMKLLYRYNHSLLDLSAMNPSKGASGEGATVTLEPNANLLTLLTAQGPGLVAEDVKIRFGSQLHTVDAEADVLIGGVLRGQLPAHLPGSVLISFTLDNTTWVESTTRFTFICKGNEYIYTHKSDYSTCEPCGDLSEQCDGSYDFYQKDDYWRDPSRPANASVWKCKYVWPKGQSCKAVQTRSDQPCASGYTGIVCSICEENYKKSAAGCNPCDEAVFAGETVLAIMLLVVLVIMIVLNCRRMLQQKTNETSLDFAEAMTELGKLREGKGADVVMWDEVDRQLNNEDLDKKEMLKLVNETIIAIRQRRWDLKVEEDMEAAHRKRVCSKASLAFALLDEHGEGLLTTNELEKLSLKLENTDQHLIDTLARLKTEQVVTVDAWIFAVAPNGSLQTRARIQHILTATQDLCKEYTLSAIQLKAAAEYAKFKIQQRYQNRDASTAPPRNVTLKTSRRAENGAFSAIGAAQMVHFNMSHFNEDGLEAVLEDLLDEEDEEGDIDEDYDGERDLRFMEGDKKDGWNMQDQGMNLHRGMKIIGVAKILASNAQMLAAVVNNIDLPWSGLTLGLVNIFALVNLDLLSVFTPCINPALHTWTLAILGTPPMLSVFVAVVCLALWRCFSWKWTRVEAFFISCNLKIIFLAYPMTAAASMQGFVCQKIDGVYYQWHDLRYECYDEAWMYQALYGILGMCFYVIGVPALYYVIITRNEHKLFLEKRTHDRFSFIFQRYKPSFPLWETLEMCRKTLVTAAALFANPGSYLQLVIAIGLSASFLMLHLKYLPFVSVDENRLQTGSLTALLLTMCLSVLLKSGESTTTASQMIVGANIGVLVFAMWVILTFTIPGYAGLFRGCCGCFSSVRRQSRDGESPMLRGKALVELEEPPNSNDCPAAEDHRVDVRSTPDEALLPKNAADEALPETTSGVYREVRRHSEETAKDDTADLAADVQNATAVGIPMSYDGPIDRDICDKLDRFCVTQYMRRHKRDGGSKDLIEAYHRYDLDASGLIDNLDEAQSLTMNVVFALNRTEGLEERHQKQLVGAAKAVQVKCSELDWEANPMDVVMFARWFDAEFLGERK